MRSHHSVTIHVVGSLMIEVIIVSKIRPTVETVVEVVSSIALHLIVVPLLPSIGMTKAIVSCLLSKALNSVHVVIVVEVVATAIHELIGHAIIIHAITIIIHHSRRCIGLLEAIEVVHLLVTKAWVLRRG